MANIVYDDVASLVATGGGSWSTVTDNRYFGGSTIYPPFSYNDDGDTGDYATLTLTFQGTSLALIGNTPSSACSQYADVSIDGGSTAQSSYSDPSPQNTMQWYQSPTLSDGSHTISITRIAGTSLDYMVVAAGLTTPLSGQTLIVDDGDSAMSYFGTWTNPTGRYVTGTADGVMSSVEFYPHENAVHRSGTVGSYMTFEFTGTSVSVYGVFDFDTQGHMVVVYTVDSTAHTQPYTVPTTEAETLTNTGSGHRGNVLLFTSTGLTAGTHTLKIEITSNNYMALALDYILYTPSFYTLAAKLGINTATLTTSTTSLNSPTTSPSSTASGEDVSVSVSVSISVSNPSSLTGSSSSSRNLTATDSSSVTTGLLPSGSSVSSSASVVPSGGAASSNSNDNNTAADTTSSTTSSPPIGAIVGAVLGAALVALLIFPFILCRRRRRRSLFSRIPPPHPGTATNDDHSQASKPEDRLLIKPFVDTVPSSTYHEDVKTPIPNNLPMTQTANDSVPPSDADISRSPESSAVSDLVEIVSTALTGSSLAASDSYPVSSSIHNQELSPSPTSRVHKGRYDDDDITHPTNTPRRRPTGGRTPNSATRVLRGRVQHLQEVVQELDLALSNPHSDSAYIAELRGRMRQLTREDGEFIELSDVSSYGVPPPYQR